MIGFACALYDPTQGVNAVIKTCHIPNDQSGTITGHWLVTPIPIALHQNDFAANEAEAITASADSWNHFFTASKSLNTLDYGSGSARTAQSTNPASSGNICSQGILQGKQFSGNVVIYKNARWASYYPSTAMALTTTCFLQAKPYPTFYMSIMELNYQNFFIQGTKIPDLQTITLHELGHLHGLNHTCEMNPKVGTPNCTSPNLNPDYYTASMFPTFNFDSSGNGQQKRSLGANDQSRANCLYTGTSAK
jgi:hypothetical protein